MKQHGLFDDDGGYAEVRGTKVIYVPKGQAGEYAKLASNPYVGCGHKCVYCYVPRIIKMDRKQFDSGAYPKPGFLDRVRKDAEKFEAAGVKEQVMLSFTTDPYCPSDVVFKLTRQVLIELAKHGMGFCTLTKGGHKALRDIELFRPKHDAFASTLTTLSAKQSQEWESGAAPPAERLSTLRKFHEAGIFTWVSLEPVYDTDMAIALIKETAAFVDLFKIGRINYHRITRQIDWREFTEKVLKVVNDLKKKHYIKQDLQPFLPKGYHNPRYINQVRHAR